MRVGSIPVLDNSESYAGLMERETESRARAVVAASTPSSPPPLRRGDRLEVLWGDQWFAGCFSSGKPDPTDRRVRLSHIRYDAVDVWPEQSVWHDLSTEEWRRLE